jgi:hypothetical protein
MRLDAGEPIALLVPARRGELETFAPRLLALDDDAEVSAAYRAWRRSRETFLTDLAAGARSAVEAGWQRDYFRGRGPDDREVPEHQTKMALRGFNASRR